MRTIAQISDLHFGRHSAAAAEDLLASLRAVDPDLVKPEALFDLVRAGFGQRRKMLRRALAGLVSPEVFAAAGVDPAARAEELDVVAWGRLATCRQEAE